MSQKIVMLNVDPRFDILLREKRLKKNLRMLEFYYEGLISYSNQSLGVHIDDYFNWVIGFHFDINPSDLIDWDEELWEDVSELYMLYEGSPLVLEHFDNIRRRYLNPQQQFHLTHFNLQNHTVLLKIVSKRD